MKHRCAEMIWYEIKDVAATEGLIELLRELRAMAILPRRDHHEKGRL